MNRHTTARQALTRWSIDNASVRLIAQRENLVYQAHDQQTGQTWALRLHRSKLRNLTELVSESQWLQALSNGGLNVPTPVMTKDELLCIEVNGQWADLQGWLPGRTLTHHPQPKHYRRLGQSMAQLHRMSDAWPAPCGFQRPAWNREGLVGNSPVWGRFWDNPNLNSRQQTLLYDFKIAASQALETQYSSQDYGLIHADLVPENVLVDEEQLHLIDFDDGGYGYRLFDLATVILRLQREPQHEILTHALIEGYTSERTLNLDALDFFIALRACTYIGWVIPRMNEPEGAERCSRFIEIGCKQATNWIEKL